jgi:MFS family permease
MKRKSIFRLSKNVWSLGWVSFFNDASSEMIYPLLPLFLTQVLGAGVLFVGLVEGIAESVSSFLKLFSGWFSDKFQKKKWIIFSGYFLASATRPFMGLATSAYHFFTGMATLPASLIMGFFWEMMGVAWAFCFGAGMAFIAAFLAMVLLSDS